MTTTISSIALSLPATIAADDIVIDYLKYHCYTIFCMYTTSSIVPSLIATITTNDIVITSNTTVISSIAIFTSNTVTATSATPTG